MDKTTVTRTKSAINALLDVYQYWIDFAPEYNLTKQDIAKLQKKLRQSQDNIEKIYKTSEEMAEKL